MLIRCPLVTPKLQKPCSYVLRGMTGLQELRVFERHLKHRHPDERRSALELRELAEDRAIASERQREQWEADCRAELDPGIRG